MKQANQWRPVFCHPPGEEEGGSATEKELWCCYMEKAWAKLFGSYEAIAGGLCSDALNYLTGGLTFNVPDDQSKVPQRRIPRLHQSARTRTRSLAHSLTLMLTLVKLNRVA
eukprot:COSAG01_NODE_2539_length_7485_cov_49.290650_1_plen_111_part_00